MLITTNELLNCGLPISDEIEQNKIEYSIQTAENYILKPRIGDELYIAINTAPADYTVILDGGIYTKDDGKQVAVTGLKKALCELAFSEILFENIDVTSFSTVKKKDDYSTNTDKDEIYFIQKLHVERGIFYINEVLDALGMKKTTKDYSNIDEWL